MSTRTPEQSAEYRYRTYIRYCREYERMNPERAQRLRSMERYQHDGPNRPRRKDGEKA